MVVTLSFVSEAGMSEGSERKKKEKKNYASSKKLLIN